MNFLELLILAVGLSMDAFAVSVCKGLCLNKTNYKHMCIAGIWFGGFQALMPLIGFYLANTFSNAISKYSHWIAFILLLFIGIKMIKEAFETDNDINNAMDGRTMLPLAVATSIDALAIGVTFSFLKIRILPAISTIGITTFLFSAAGIKIGSIFGAKYKTKAEVLGGIILVILGIKTLLSGIL